MMRRERLPFALVTALIAVFAIAGAALAEQKTTGPGTGDGSGAVGGLSVSGYSATTNTDYITGTSYTSATTSYPVVTGIGLHDGIQGGCAGCHDTHGDVRGHLHTNFKKSTETCALCHSTHTGVGAKLLQWETTTRACVACHDGTLGLTYNVMQGYIATTGSRTFGGLFPPDTSPDWSRHAVFDSVKINAAPGGARYVSVLDDSKGKWTTDFGCASCHSPHGQGGNARLLNPDPNGVASLNKKSNFLLTPIDLLTFVAYNGAAASGNEFTWIKGYPYDVLTKVYANGILQTSGYTVDNSAGYTVVRFAQAPDQPVTANFVPSVRVRMSIANFLNGNETVTYRSGINQFCGACHPDYNTETVSSPGQTPSGYYTSAYRHQVGMIWSTPVEGLKFEGGGSSGTVVCLTCHVAHGTDKGYRLSTLAGIEGGYWTSATVAEARGNGKSALKRKPNMGTCETCHQKGPGSQGYNADSQ